MQLSKVGGGLKLVSENGAKATGATLRELVSKLRTLIRLMPTKRADGFSALTIFVLE